MDLFAGMTAGVMLTLGGFLSASFLVMWAFVEKRSPVYTVSGLAGFAVMGAGIALMHAESKEREARQVAEVGQEWTTPAGATGVAIETTGSTLRLAFGSGATEWYPRAALAEAGRQEKRPRARRNPRP